MRNCVYMHTCVYIYNTHTHISKYIHIHTNMIFLNWDSLFHHICKHHLVILGKPIQAEKENNGK